MSSVRQRFPRLFFLLKASSSFLGLFLSARCRVLKRSLGVGSGVSRCSSCYPCTAPQGRHHLTHTVTAKKRARPISTSGRCRPQCAAGRAPFQIYSVGCWHGLQWGGWGRAQTIRRPSASPNQRLWPARCASATGLRPSAGRSPRWLSCARPWWLWGCPQSATIF